MNDAAGTEIGEGSFDIAFAGKDLGPGGQTRALFALAAGATLALAPAHANAQAAPSDPTARTTPAASDSGYAAVNGIKIYYQVHGDPGSGETPLLVLHGAFMSGDGMKAMIDRFATSRPVIAIDARGHGRTGDAEGGLTYEILADDAAGVLESLDVETADVLGYSMGGNTAILMALRHPERVGKLVSISATYRRDGWYPEVLEGMAQMTPEMFAGTGMEAEYRRLSPTPDAFPTLVEEIKALEELPQAWPEDAIRAIEGRTMIIIGDGDSVQLEHAVDLFKLRGGGDVEAATQGFMTEPPRARLAILPGTSHLGIMAQPELIAALVTPFLDDVQPAMPEGFF